VIGSIWLIGYYRIFRIIVSNVSWHFSLFQIAHPLTKEITCSLNVEINHTKDEVLSQAGHCNTSLCCVGYRVWANLMFLNIIIVIDTNILLCRCNDHCNKHFLCSRQFGSKYNFSKPYLAVVETIFFYPDISDNYDN